MSNESGFEDGKELEQYTDELSKIEKTLAIEPEKYPEGQPLENVAEVIEKPVKKKESEKKPIVESKKSDVKAVSAQIILPPAAPIAPPIVEPQQVTKYTEKEVANSIEQKPVEPTPCVTVEKPVATEAIQPPQQTPVFHGIDNYIEETAKAIGQNAEETFRKNAYTNLLAVINGQVRIVPIEQEQPIQAEPVPDQVAIAEAKLVDLQQIEVALKDPANKSRIRELLQWKCELLQIPFTEDMMPIVIPAPMAISAESPVSSKLSEPKKEKPKRSAMSKMKLIALSTALAITVTIGVIIAIGFFMS
jgi:hypothetical protein